MMGFKAGDIAMTSRKDYASGGSCWSTKPYFHVLLNEPDTLFERPTTAWIVTYLDDDKLDSKDIHSVREVDLHALIWTFTGFVLKPSERHY
jgi:hypothetical protein